MNKYVTLLKRSAPALLSLFASMYTLVQVFPYLPWMVQHILPGVDVRDIDYYSGIIASAQFLGRMTSSFLWGWLADRIGRKNVLIISGTLLAMATLGFGFSVTILMAILFRFLIGLFNGIVPTAKAAISELSDDSTQPFIMGFLSSIFTLGLVLGPAVSGFLADPIKQYGISPDWFFVKFPYVLPSIANAVVVLISVVVVCFFMNETIKIRRIEFKTVPVATSESEDSEANKKETRPLLSELPETKTSKIGYVFGKIRGSVLYELLTNRTVMLLLLLNSVYSMVVLTLDEVVPLWAQLERTLGGLEMSIRCFSIITSISSLVALPFNVFLFQLMERRFGTLRSYLIMLSLLTKLFVLLPSVTIMHNNIASWICFGLFMLVLRFLISGISAAFLVFINNSVEGDKLGSVNGLAASLCSLFRAVAPIYGCSVFSASLKSHFFPFDYHLIFILNGIILGCCILVSLALPERLNRKMSNFTDVVIEE